jgi:L-fuconolactonase
MIDAHVHFWNYNKTRDTWITDEMKILQRDFLPKDIELVLKENNVDGVVAVQADQSEFETIFLLELSRPNHFIKGIVGWVNFQDKNIEERLQYFSQFKIIKGFRHIVQAEPDKFLENENFLKGIRSLKSFGYTYDVLIYPNQLKYAIEFVNKFPGQKFIIDHCAKPFIKNKAIEEWKKYLKEISHNENVYCKLSGLFTEAAWNEWNDRDFYPYLDVVFESFGTSRLVYGSDWPVMLLSGKYRQWKNLLENYMKNFSNKEKQNVFNKNAVDFYDLEALRI